MSDLVTAKDMALAINGGDWDADYTEAQKRGWQLKADYCNTRPAPVPRVKPLEWVNASGGFEATSLLGVWRILWRPDGMFSVTLNGEIVGGICTTFEKAKAAAFEHYERRILSALDMEKDDG